MVAIQLLVIIFIAAASATGLVAREDAYFASLLKRQEPGTPAYNCHDNCGSAITLSRSADPCNNAVFVADYNNCLKCSGPDNYNIWRYYGGTLSSAGAKCGFDTEPLAGKQEDVPAAGSTGGASSAAPAQTSAATQSSAAPSATPSAAASSAPAPSSAAGAGSQAATTTEATTSESPVSSAAVSSALLTTVISPVISSAPVYPTIIANGTLSSPVSGVPSPSTNASASFTASAPAEVTTNVAAGLRVADAAGVFGAVLLGAFFGM